MIPRSQHLRDRAPFPRRRSGEMRIFEQPRLEALVLTAFGRAHYAGEQPDASIEKRKSGDLAAGEDVIADRQRLDLARLEQPLVDPLEAAAEDDCAGSSRKGAYLGLVEWPAARGHRQHR